MNSASKGLELPKPEDIQAVAIHLQQLLGELNQLLLGRETLHKLVVTAMLSRGHVLLEGLPGLGKTALVKALSHLLGLSFKRVQFTPDLMPSDILGAHLLEETNTGSREMVFRPGPIFTNLLLADEINRASPKTQSALLEAMQEQAVTLLGTTLNLPEPFLVMASQNPIDLEGTYPLPEAQLDRFLFKLHVGALDGAILTDILTSRRRGAMPLPAWTLGETQMAAALAMMDRIALPHAVAGYIARVVSATHPEGSNCTADIKQFVTFGASPRAAIAIAEAARAWALLEGRPSVGFEDVRIVAPHALNHRIILNYQARMEHITSMDLIEELLQSLDANDLELPAGLHLETKHG